jgi:hypothetical protein
MDTLLTFDLPNEVPTEGSLFAVSEAEMERIAQACVDQAVAHWVAKTRESFEAGMRAGYQRGFVAGSSIRGLKARKVVVRGPDGRIAGLTEEVAIEQ